MEFKKSIYRKQIYYNLKLTILQTNYYKNGEKHDKMFLAMNFVYIMLLL